LGSRWTCSSSYCYRPSSSGYPASQQRSARGDVSLPRLDHARELAREYCRESRGARRARSGRDPLMTSALDQAGAAKPPSMKVHGPGPIAQARASRIWSFNRARASCERSAAAACSTTLANCSTWACRAYRPMCKRLCATRRQTGVRCGGLCNPAHAGIRNTALAFISPRVVCRGAA
jgi:hypothetical protein